jgi:hypothetical protein
MSNKRKHVLLSTTLNEVADECTCPLTHELPLDPVLAEDGCVYERTSIEAWIAKCTANEQPLRSPLHNTPMGPKLLASLHTRKMIERMVESGKLTGSKADAWKSRLKRRTDLEATLLQATSMVAPSPETKAMNAKGCRYYHGNGVKQNYTRAFNHFKRAADLGDVCGIGNVGDSMSDGHGVAKNRTLGIMMVTQAAMYGAEHSCYNLAQSFEHGWRGLPKNAKQATAWYRKMRTANIRDSSSVCRMEANTWLAAHDAAWLAAPAAPAE